MKDTDYKTKSFFEKDAEVKYYCEDPDIDKLLREIIFLYRKLKNFKSKIEKNYENFVKSTIDNFKEDARKKVRQVKKESSNEVKVQHIFISSQADNNLFFYLDTFIIDLKRIIEFSFRLIARFEGLGEIKFSLENLMNHLSEKTENQSSNLAKVLLKKYPPYVKFILANEDWLKSLNDRRMRSIHYEVFNKSGEFTIEYLWTSTMNIEDEPLITFPKIPFFNKPIPEFVKEEMESIKQFLSKILYLGKDKIKEVEII